MTTPPGKGVSPIYGLVLAGGASARMGRDKATLDYHGEPQGLRCCRLLSEVCECTFVSLSETPEEGHWSGNFPVISDAHNGIGPMDGVLSAMTEHPGVAWLVVACDLPLISNTALVRLATERDTESDATAYLSADGRPEPLFALYEPGFVRALKKCVVLKRYSLRDLLIESLVHAIQPLDAETLINVNTPEDYERISGSTNKSGKTVK